MKRIHAFATTVLTLLFATAVAFAGVPAKTELTFSGSYVNPEDGPAVWVVGGDVLFPLTSQGVIVLGPSIAMSSVDEYTGAGAVLEFNVTGQNGGFFFGGSAIYYLDSFEEQDDHTAGARAGIKLPLSQSGLFKLYVEQGLTGRGRDADLTGALAAVIKF